MTNKEEIYDAWAPPASPWSPWVKPAPFAHLRQFFHVAPAEAPPPLDIGWLPAADSGIALVIDLPGVECIHLALQAAARSWQPVSLLSACPSPTRTVTSPPINPLSSLPAAIPAPARSAVDVDALLSAMVGGAAKLAASPVPSGAPPAFFLDAQRQAPGVPVVEEMFDNRSVVFASDFPSAETLRAHGIAQILVIRRDPPVMAHDLAFALAPWRKAGLPVEVRGIDGTPAPAAIPSTGIVAQAWHPVPRLPLPPQRNRRFRRLRPGILRRLARIFHTCPASERSGHLSVDFPNGDPCNAG